MKQHSTRRLDRIQQAIDTMPICPNALQKARDHFRETGELPEQQRLAGAVTNKAINPHDDLGDSELGRRIRAAQARVDGAQGKPSQPPPPPSPVRDLLFNEAVYGPDFVRQVARRALVWEVDIGADPTDPHYLGDRELPKFGSVGLMMLGYPKILAKAPYVDQANRLFDRYGALLARIGPDNEQWERAYLDAATMFYEDGRLPRDELMRDAVLGSVEIDALYANRRGDDVSELMAVLDSVAQTEEPERSRLIEGVYQVVPKGLRRI